MRRDILFLSILLIATNPAYARDREPDPEAVAICRVRGDDPGFVGLCSVVMEAERGYRLELSEESLQRDLAVVERAAEVEGSGMIRKSSDGN